MDLSNDDVVTEPTYVVELPRLIQLPILRCCCTSSADKRGNVMIQVVTKHPMHLRVWHQGLSYEVPKVWPSSTTTTTTTTTCIVVQSAMNTLLSPS
jgi:hypothetical protein